MTATKGNDIVMRLRRSDGFTVDRSVAGYPSIHPDYKLLLEAANEIERLQTALREIRDAPAGALRTTAVRDVACRALEIKS